MALIALAGLPGTGKSTLARALSAGPGAPVFDKDVVRAELFAPDRIEYSREQDDAVMEIVYRRAFARLSGDAPHVLIDGRTYSRRPSVERLRAVAAERGVPLLLVECRCPDDVARLRLAADGAAGGHLAANRTPELHRRLAAEAEPIVPPTFVLDTHALALPEQVAAVVAALVPAASRQRE